MSQFHVDASGQGELQKILGEFRRRGQTLDRHLPAVGELLIAGVNDIVDMEGPGWDSLSEVTLQKRRKNGRGAKMLRDTGVMMSSLSAGYGPDYVDVAFGTSYAKYFTDEKYESSKRNPFELGPIEDELFGDITDVLMKGLG